MNYNEQELISRVQRGDKAAFTAIYNRYQPMLHMEAFYKIHQHEEAEDIVQEVFTSLWKRRAEIDINVSLKSFLYKAVHFQFTTRVRKIQSGRKYLSVAEFNEIDEKNGQQSLEKKEVSNQLREAVESITSAACRKIVQLAYLQQKSHKEISEELNVNLNIVKNQASRGVKALRLSFKKD
jgi:RNA polymerase sigma factor (sigma-70 family)